MVQYELRKTEQTQEGSVTSSFTVEVPDTAYGADLLRALEARGYSRRLLAVLPAEED